MNEKIECSNTLTLACRVGGSRFRGANVPSLLYAAETVSTPAPELGYWSWRFLTE